MIRFALATFCGAVLFVRAASGFEVTQCGQVVPAHETGVLATSLDCTGAGVCADDLASCTSQSDCSPGTPCIFAAVTLQDRATLDLNGNTLSFDVNTTPLMYGQFGVQCLRRCKVHGPGTISGFVFGVYALTIKRIDVHDLVVQGLPDTGAGIYTNSPLRARNVTVTGSLYGITSFSDAHTAVLESVVVNGNEEIGIYTDRKVRGSNITANDNGEDGLFLSGYGRNSLRGLTAINNAEAGLKTRGAVILRNSTLSGNNGGGIGVDLAGPKRPVLRDTTCGHSADFSDASGSDVFGAPWGVCAGD